MVKPNKPKSRTKKSKKTKVKSFTKHFFNRRTIWMFLCIGSLLLGVVLINQNTVSLESQPSPPPFDAIYKQSNQLIEKRVSDLLSRMTLEEKIGQMALVDKNSLKNVEDISLYNLGGVLSGAGAKPAINSPKGWQDMVDSMKNQSMKSRLGIPILYGVDAIHGHANVLGATVFPHAIGLGATADRELVEDVAIATAQELKATGVNWSYSPSLDAPKDIRWGRVYEAFSDDSSLNSLLGSAYISGTQRSSAGSNVLATAKHYLATGSMVWGESNHKKFKIDQGKTSPDEQNLINQYLPPYKSAVDANVASVMVGLNQWGDQRIIDSKSLVTDKLKNELGFKGFVVSDWYGVYEYSNVSKYQANINTINAGLDMAMLPYDYKTFIKDVSKAVKKGKISQSRVDDAVERILYQKFKAGLFNTAPSTTGLEKVGSVEHHQLARKAVSESAVLLKNKNDLLPLVKNTGHILVAGSGADNVGRQCGAWTVEWQGIDGNWTPGGTSILQGIRDVTGGNSLVDYEKNGNFGTFTKKADVGIAIISEKPYAEGWGDNPNPTISKEDLQTIERLKASSNKIIVVILSGRPLLISDQIQSWDSLIAGWLPGSEGAGLADVLFGDKPFTGKLPLLWPSSINQVPTNSDGTTHDKTKPLFQRGFGL